jgi:hypothetical protein
VWRVALPAQTGLALRHCVAKAATVSKGVVIFACELCGSALLRNEVSSSIFTFLSFPFMAGVLNIFFLFHGPLCLLGEGHGPLLRIIFLNAQSKITKETIYIKIQVTK